MTTPLWMKPLNWVSGWLGRRETALLLLLIVQLGVAFGLMSAWHSHTTGPGSAATTRGGEAPAACGPLEVTFAPATELRQLQRWLINYNASIVLGPNERGAFELRAPGQTVSSLREALGPLADSVQVNPLCPSQP